LEFWHDKGHDKTGQEKSKKKKQNLVPVARSLVEQPISTHDLTETTMDYDSMKVEELKAELKKHGLSTTVK
jgi:hypothetical protein